MIYNGAQKHIVVRPFAAGYCVDFSDMIMIPPGGVADVLTVQLSGYDLSEPYVIQGAVLVRDWGPLRIIPDHKIPSVVLRPGDANSYKKDFALDPTKCEGFQVAFLDDSKLIRFWFPT